MADLNGYTLSQNLADWMGELPDGLHKIPVNQLIIPGSHDSLSFSLDPNAGVAPDNENMWSILIKVLGGPLAKRIMYHWSLTQIHNTTSQLEAGIRYFDLRIAAKNTTNGTELRAVHGLYGENVEAFFDAMKSFLTSHPKELVLLHFQHLYDMREEDHQSLIRMLTTSLGSIMVPYTSTLDGLTLEYLWAKQFQVICFYDHPSLAKLHPFLWPTAKIPNPWPNKDDIPSLSAFWDLYYRQGYDKDEFFVFQGVGTPQVSTIVRHATSSLRRSVVRKVNPALAAFIADKIAQHNYVGKLNVVMFDFVNAETPAIAETLVNMNAVHLMSGSEDDVLTKNMISALVQGEDQQEANLGDDADVGGGTGGVIMGGGGSNKLKREASIHVTVGGVSIEDVDAAAADELLRTSSVTADVLSENLKGIKFADE